MGNELYQLVAIDKFNNEYVIELNNDNKNNKGSLSFIDYGTSTFKNKEALATYLYNNKKIPTEEVYFSIRYYRNGPKYLPLIYDDKILKSVSKDIDNDRYNDFVFYVLKQLEVQLTNRVFFRYITTKNIENVKEDSNGNHLNQKLIDSIIEYYNVFIRNENIDSNRAELQYAILSEIFNYKQLRTLYMFMEEYSKKIDQIEVKYEKPNKKDTDDIPFIPPDIDYAYKQGGMDEVYSTFDLDDLENQGIRFK